MTRRGRRICRFGVALSLMALVAGKAWAADLETALSLVREGYSAEAVVIFRDLALAGDSAAQVNLAVMHARGEGVPLDEIEAGYWAWRARLMGDRRAAHPSDVILAKLHRRARNRMAERLSTDLQKLAEEGKPQAFVALGRVETEIRQPPKPQTAALWFTIAAAFEVRYGRALREVATKDLSDAARLDVQLKARTTFSEWCQRVPGTARPASCPVSDEDKKMMMARE